VPVAALYDVHGNLPALEAVLAEVRSEGVDQVVVGGDVLPGPMPRETLELLIGLDLPISFIYGNGEVAVLDVVAGRVPARVPEAYRPIITWNAQQIDSGQHEVIRSWPKTLAVDVAGVGRVLFCHATPRDENEIFLSTTAEEKLRPVFDCVDAQLVVCGHTHMQFDRTVGSVRVVNAGSVGMPFADPGAYWLLVGPGIELRRTGYDLDAAANRIRRSHYPQAEQFANNSILHPPSEAQMIELFRPAELK